MLTEKMIAQTIIQTLALATTVLMKAMIIAIALKPPLTKYEMGRISWLKENDEKLLSLGIMPLFASLKSSVVHNSKTDDKDHDNDEGYNPEKEDDVQSDDTSGRIKVVKKKKLAQGPRTRSQANAAAVLKEPRKDGTENAKEVSSVYRAPALKPTCSKVFQLENNNGEAPGSVNAYLALRERQKQNIEVPTTPQDVPQLNLEEPVVAEIVKPDQY